MYQYIYGIVFFYSFFLFKPDVFYIGFNTILAVNGPHYDIRGIYDVKIPPVY